MMSRLAFSSIFCAVLVSSRIALAAMTVQSPRCEYLVDPMGIDTTQPRLSWVVADDRRGAAQSAYQVLVASSPDKLAANTGDLWDSGKVKSDQTIQIPYAGAPLQAGQRCYWKARAWDQGDVPSDWSPPATWTMGLLAESDWAGAKWITPASLDGPPAIATGPHNGFHSELVTAPDDTHWVQIDLGAVQSIDSVRLFPAHPFDFTPTPGFLFPVRWKIEVASSADLADGRVVVDHTQDDFANPGDSPVSESFAPTQGRYVRLTAIKLAQRPGGGYGLALCQMQALAGDKVLSLHRPVRASDSIENGEWSAQELTDGNLKPIRGAAPPPRRGATYMRRQFTIDSPISRATAYITALGLYELSINGKRVGDHRNAPEWTDYRKRVQYQVYDVTDLLKSGDNALGVAIGDGWFAGPLQTHEFTGTETPRLLMRLDVSTADGKTQTLVSDENWKASRDGPIRANGIYFGESYDARKEMPGWDSPGFDDSKWLASAPVADDVYTDAPRVAQHDEPIRVMQELHPVSMNQPAPGTWVFDMGQNMVGCVRASLTAKAGEPVVILHGEMLNPDGTLYTPNLRGAGQRLEYIPASDGPFTIEPHFTYMGFRYVQITGVAEAPSMDSVVGRVFYTGASDAGTFECSDKQINQLMHNIYWTQRANLQGVPTDCPQRSERMGWMGDIQAFSQTAIYNMDLAAFFTKWMADVRDGQSDDGRFSDFSPNPGNANRSSSGAMAWADAGTVVPWRAYENKAPKPHKENHKSAAKRWVDFLLKRDPTLTRGLPTYGDWLNADTLVHDNWPRTGGAIRGDIFTTIFFANSARIVSKMAAVIGNDADAKTYGDLYDRVRQAFNDKFVSPDGHIEGDTQAAYALALDFDLLPADKRPAALKYLLAGIDRYGGHLSTGIQSTHHLMLELSRDGQHDLAMKLANLTTFPSWGFMIENGATTIWERWDGYVKGRGFQDPEMNSFNHWALGSVGEWVWRDIAGINGDDDAPGFKHIIIRPLPDPSQGLSWARSSYRSIRGLISSDWKLDGGKFTLDVTIPPGTTADVYVPAADPSAVTESGKPAASAEGVKGVRNDQGCAVLAIQSGHYLFQSATP